KICDGILLKQEEQAVQEEQAAQSFLLNWTFPMVDDDEYTIIYRSSKAITPDLPTEELDNSLSMGDENLNTIPETKSDEVIKSSVKNLVPIPSEPKGISDDICDVPFCNNGHFDAEFGLINSLLSRDISITSSKIDFLPEEFAGELNLIDPILPGIDEDDFDEEEGEIDELNEDECFDPGGGEIVFSQNVKDDDSFTFFIQTFLPFLTYPEDYPLLFSTGSEDTIFDPRDLHLEPVASHQDGTFMCFNVYPNINESLIFA
ncbi:hypothetical protein Tco_0114386, partial [Tanacetum coccineum]